MGAEGPDGLDGQFKVEGYEVANERSRLLMDRFGLQISNRGVSYRGSTGSFKVENKPSPVDNPITAKMLEVDIEDPSKIIIKFRNGKGEEGEMHLIQEEGSPRRLTFLKSEKVPS